MSTRNTLKSADLDTLEGLIDRSTLADVLDALACICDAKAEHVASNWQDHALAKRWRTAARRLDAFVVRPSIAAVSL